MTTVAICDRGEAGPSSRPKSGQGSPHSKVSPQHQGPRLEEHCKREIQRVFTHTNMLSKDLMGHPSEPQPR